MKSSENLKKVRLDCFLVEQGYFDSRERAQRALLAGQVLVDDQRLNKPGTKVRPNVRIEVAQGEKYVGRGGLKLEKALEVFKIDPTEKICLDIGASTGGFTDCLLQHGAKRVHALDVGKGQLHWKIRQDPRVKAQEGLNCRYLTFDNVGENIDLCVIDVSFISLTLILPPVFEIVHQQADMVVLIKPQFEVTRDKVGKGGIVTNLSYRESAVTKIQRFVTEQIGHQWCGWIESPIQGGSGNVEYLAHLRK